MTTRKQPWLLGIMIPLLLLGGANKAEAAEPPVLQAEAAVLIDAKTGTVLYGNQENARMYPASITKIVTGIMALESGTLNDIVTVSKEARGEDGTRVYLAEGEQVPMEKLVYGLLVNSGNDAGTAIAEHIAGSKENFASLMNEFVREKAGVVNTHFTNPHGLHDENHYTTAKDMAAIARYAMKNEKFREVVGTVKMPWTGKEWQSQLENHNRLLTSYEGATGVKNGYTSKAGSTLVASASRGGTELIGVILKAASNKELYAGMSALLDYGFQGFETKLLMEQGETRTVWENGEERTFIAREPVWYTAPKGVVPVISVNGDGQVSVPSSSAPEAVEPIATLELLSVKGEPAKETEASGDGLAEDIPDPADRPENTGWVIAFASTWLLHIAFVTFLAVLLRRKRLKRL